MAPIGLAKPKSAILYSISYPVDLGIFLSKTF
jgi:hypothetical protein